MYMPGHSLICLQGTPTSLRILCAGAQMVALFIKYPPDQKPPPRAKLCSTMRVLMPIRPRSWAQMRPDGPAPTMMTSLSIS